MTDKHTPTPWVTREAVESGVTIIASAEKIIARCFRRADAAHAIRAVNAHNELVEALKLAFYYLDNSDSPGGCDGKHDDCEHCSAIAFVRAALAKAGGVS